MANIVFVSGRYHSEARSERRLGIHRDEFELEKYVCPWFRKHVRVCTIGVLKYSLHNAL